MSQLVLTDSDNGKTMSVQVGNLVIVRIAENPSTGYRWEIEKQDTQLLELQNSDYKATTEGLAGGGGERSFTFRAAQTGNTEIRLKLWRQWVGDSSVIKRYSATVQIQA